MSSQKQTISRVRSICPRWIHCHKEEEYSWAKVSEKTHSLIEFSANNVIMQNTQTLSSRATKANANRIMFLGYTISGALFCGEIEEEEQFLFVIACIPRTLTLIFAHFNTLEMAQKGWRQKQEQIRVWAEFSQFNLSILSRIEG